MNKDTLWLQVPAATQRDNIQIEIFQSSKPSCAKQVKITLFAADHGVTTEPSFSFSQSITVEIIKKFIHRIPSTYKIIENFKVKLEIINLGTVENIKSIDGIINQPLGTSTADFCYEPAMNREQFSNAINIGRQSAQRAKLCGTQFLICSDINKQNTIAATAMTCALLNIAPEQLIDIKYEGDKIQLIKKALAKHKGKLKSPLEILRRLGGFEIAALTGSYLCCAHMGLPVLINGFTNSVAALIAAQLCPDAEKWFLYSDTPEEQGHKLILENLNAQLLCNSISHEKHYSTVTNFSKMAS